MDWIKVNVTGEFQEIIFILHKPGLKGPLEQGTNAILLFVNRFGVRDKKGLHDGLAEVFAFDVDQEVVVIGHEAVGDN